MKAQPDTNYQRLAAPVAIAGSTARVECAECGSLDRWNIARRPPPDQLPKHFAAKGWNLRKRPICPACVLKKEKKPMTANVSPINPANDGKDASEAAKKAKRLIYQALEDYYDDSRKTYRDGHSDKTIAEEVGASEKFVSTIRESDFGPLAEPEEIRVFKGDVSRLTSEIGKLQTRLADLCRKQGWTA